MRRGYIVKLFNLADIQLIFHVGSYTIRNRPVILKPWTLNINFNIEFLAEVPLSDKLPKLSMSFRSCDFLSTTFSAIGVPLFADEFTTK